MNRKLNYLLIFLSLNVISINSFAQLNGTYTIGPSGSYKTITQAVIALYNFGVLGPVTFNIENGIYDEQVYVPFINNASVYNLITFQSQSGDSTKVIIRFKPTSDSMNYTLMLDGVSYLIFKKLTFTTDTVTGRVIDINNQCNFNQFINNRIIGMQDSKELVYSQDTSISIDNYNRFENNLFQYGSIGIAFAGADNTTLEQGTDIYKNYFLDQSQKAIELKYSYNFKVRNNTISSSLGISDFTGIKIQYCTDKFSVEKNKIDIGNKSQTCHGIAVISTNASSLANASTISNNFIHAFSNDYVYMSGLEILGSFINFYYNSVNLTGNNEASVGFYDIIASNINIENNIFSNQSKGLSMTLNDTATIFSDYNDLYSNGIEISSEGMNYYSILSDWYAATKKDQHSISTDPLFFSSTDLHTKNFRLSKKGKSIVGFTSDIDGNTRKSPKPDIGADEFLYKLDLGPDRFICANLKTTITAEQGFDTYNWSNGDTTSSITVDSTGVGLGTKSLKLIVNYQGNVYSDSVLVHFIMAHADIGPDEYVCEGEKLVLQATGGVKFNWNNGDTSSSISFTANKLTRYSVTVTDQYGCVDSTSICINVKPRPSTPTIILYGSDSLKSSVIGSIYTWFLNKSMLTDHTMSIKAKTDGTYMLIVYDSACPSDTSAGYIFKYNSIENSRVNERLRLYPSPANKIMTVELYVTDLSKAELEILSLLGKRIYYCDHLSLKNEINVTAFPKGIYFIKLSSEGQTLMEKFVVQ